MRCADIEREKERSLLAVAECDGHGVLRGDSSFRIAQSRLQDNGFHLHHIIGDFDLNLHGSHLFGDIGSGDEDAVRIDVRRIADHQVDIAVDAAAGIPPSARDAVLDDDFDGIILTGLHKAGHIEIEIAVAVSAFSGKCIIDVNKSILVDALELEKDAFSRGFFVQLQNGLVNHIYFVEIAVSGAVRLGRIPRNLHQQIVRQNNCLRDGSAAEKRTEGTAVAFFNCPALIESDFFHDNPPVCLFLLRCFPAQTDSAPAAHSAI